MARAKDGPGSRTGPSTTSDTKLCPAMRLDRTLGGSASQRRDSHRCTPSTQKAANGQQGTYVLWGAKLMAVPLPLKRYIF